MSANLIARLLLKLKFTPDEIESADTTTVNWHFYAERLARSNGNAGRVFRDIARSDAHGGNVAAEVAMEIMALAPKSFLANALHYASMGWHIFPLRPRDKQPLTKHGYKEATLDLAQIIQWWTATPAANIGLACEASGLAVIDLDGDSGNTTWEQLKEQHGIFESPFVSLTPGRAGKGPGRHLLYLGTVRSTTDKLGANIDTRGEGGYIVLPPSIHPDHLNGPRYQWADESQLANPPPDLPDVIGELIEQADTPVDPWEIFTLVDAFKPRPPTVWLVDGVIEAGTLCVLYGAPGALKSLLLQDLSICVASGLDWLVDPLTGKGKPTTQASAMWLDFDNGRRLTHQRIEAVARARSLPVTTPFFYVSMPDPHLDAGDTQAMHDLAARIQARGVRLVLIDNLGVICGNADENSAEMQAPMGGLRWLAETTGAAVVVLHHQRKARPYGEEKRVGETLRGHGSIEAKLDLALLTSRDDLIVTLTPTKVRGAPVETIAAKYCFENDAHRQLVKAFFQPAATPDIKAQAKDEMMAKILDALKQNGGPMTQTKLFDEVGGNRTLFRGCLGDLVLARKVDTTNGPRNSQLYCLTNVVN